MCELKKKDEFISFVYMCFIVQTSEMTSIYMCELDLKHFVLALSQNIFRS